MRISFGQNGSGELLSIRCATHKVSMCFLLSSQDKLRFKGITEGFGHLVSCRINTKALRLSEGAAQDPLLILFVCLGRVVFKVKGV